MRKCVVAILAVVMLLAGFGGAGCATTKSNAGDQSVSSNAERTPDCADPKEEIPDWMIDCPNGK